LKIPKFLYEKKIAEKYSTGKNSIIIEKQNLQGNLELKEKKKTFLST